MRGSINIVGGFPLGSDGKESASSAGDPGSILGLGRSLGEENGYPPQYSCLENPMDRGAWGATVHGITKSWTGLTGLSTHTPIGLRSRPYYYYYYF